MPPEAERASLTKTEQELRSKQTEIDTNDKDRTTRLAMERGLALTERSREELTQELDSLAASRKELAELNRRRQAELSDNEVLNDKLSTQIEAINKQTIELTRWENLSKLIGSSDGKNTATSRRESRSRS